MLSETKSPVERGNGAPRPQRQERSSESFLRRNEIETETLLGLSTHSLTTYFPPTLLSVLLLHLTPPLPVSALYPSNRQTSTPDPTHAQHIPTAK